MVLHSQEEEELWQRLKPIIQIQYNAVLLLLLLPSLLVLILFLGKIRISTDIFVGLDGARNALKRQSGQSPVYLPLYSVESHRTPVVGYVPLKSVVKYLER